jgi:hypothetical protein
VALTEEEILFLDTLCGFGYDHATEKNIKAKLLELGFDDAKFAVVKRRLLFSGYIGSIYGNLTLEKKDYREKVSEGQTH